MNYEAWKKWWTEIAPTYFTSKVWKFSRPDLIKQLNIQKDTKVLEIGFGYGRELLNFCKLSNEVCGLELTEWACENVQNELIYRGCPYVPMLFPYDGLKIPFNGNAFDIIYNCFVIQHLSREHAKALIMDALRTLKPGGIALFEFFGDPVFYNQGADVFSESEEHGYMYNNAYTAEELPEFILSCGGVMLNHYPWPITPGWGNHWVTFTKGS